jgi:hypothetical protein
LHIIAIGRLRTNARTKAYVAKGVGEGHQKLKPSAALSVISRGRLSRGIRLSMDGKGAWRDNVFVGRVWRSVKYEEVYLKAYESVGHARRSIGDYINLYNRSRARIRELLGVVPAGIGRSANDVVTVPVPPTFVCRHCGSPMVIIDILQRSRPIRAPPVE